MAEKLNPKKEQESSLATDREKYQEKMKKKLSDRRKKAIKKK
jgi:hypothetical protein